MTWEHVEYQRRLAELTAKLPRGQDDDVAFVLAHLKARHTCVDCCREAGAGRRGCPEVERAFTHRRHELMSHRERIRDQTPLGEIDARLSGKRMERDLRKADELAGGLFALQCAVDDLEEGGADREDAFTAAKAVMWDGADAAITPTVKLRRRRRQR